MKVLVSAPYLQREWQAYRPVFEAANIQPLVPEVRERLDEETLLTLLPGCDGILCGDDRITQKVVDAAKGLRVIVKWGTGIDSIASEYATSKGIPVFRTVGAFTEPVSETVIGYMLQFTRNLFRLNHIMKSGGWEKCMGHTLAECTLGIIGFGNIGRAVARKLLPFGSRILVHDIKPISVGEQHNFGVKSTSLDHLLAAANVVTLHCDLNPTSYHLMNRSRFQAMKKGAYLINTSRGPVVQERDLIDALTSGRLAGAALDVFEDEPLALDSPLRAMDQVLLSAHACNASPRCWRLVHENSIRKLFEGLGLDKAPDFSLAGQGADP